MKRFLAFFLVIVFLFAAVGCNNTDENEIIGGKKGETTLGNKTPKEAYDAAMDYVKTLENYEVIIQSDFKTTYDGETSEENATTLHKCSGDTFYYLYKSNDYEEFFLHDGTMLYKSINEINEKLDISYGDFMKSWGGVTQDGMLIPLGEASFDKKLFIPDGENYYLEFSISKQEYSDITGGTVEEPVAYKVFFDKDGNLVGFERQMVYYYYDVVLVEDSMKVTIQNVGKAEKVSAPSNAEHFATRVKAEDIDLSNVDSLDLFEASESPSDYVLLEMKVEGKSVSSSSATEAATDAQEQSDDATEKTEDYYGKILIRLYPEVAPKSVDNFKTLVGNKFYNNLTIHRIVPKFVIQGGDPKGDGTGGSEEDIFGEFVSNGFTNNLSHKRGVVSMARSDDPNSASSQFFICLDDVSATLDEKYAAFGYVVYGMDTVDYIAALETDSNDKPLVKETIQSASFVKKKA